MVETLDVAKLYVATFNRAPDADGLEYWTSSPDFSLEMVAKTFFDQPEAMELYPEDLSNEAFVVAIYKNLFDRLPDTAGYNHWVSALDNDQVTRGTAILAFINGAQGEDATILENKAEVGLYYADEGGNAEFPLDDIDETEDSVTNGKAAVDSALSSEVDVTLTADTEDLVGTSADEAFEAPIVQNPWAGGVSNSLSTADSIDGGAGSDSLYAELVPEFYGVTGDNVMDIQPEIHNVEDIDFEAMDVWANNLDNNEDDNAAADFAITIDAKNITDIDHIGSAYSDGDLVIENMTTLTSAGAIRNTNTITITMDHTDNFNSDGDASDLTVYFDEDYLNRTTETQGSQLTINMINTLNNRLNEINGDSALSLIEGFESFTFSVGETEITVDVAGHELSEVKGLIEAALTAAGIDTVTVTEYLEPAFFATNIYYEDTDTTFNAGDQAGPDYTAFILTNSAADELIEGSFALADGSRDGSLAYSQDDRPPVIEDLPISINVELEKVGRDGEGGDLIIGGKDQNLADDVDVDQNDGIEIFNITVLGGEDKPSNLGIIRSTDQTLTTVIIDSAQSENDTWADLTVRTQLGGGQELTLIDSTDFEGDFALGLSVLDVDNDGTMNTVVTGLQEALTSNFGSGNDSYNWQSDELDGVSSSKEYSISMGNGDNTVRADLDGDSVDTIGESFSLTAGSGDDDVTITMDAGVSQQTMDDLHNETDTFLDYLSISTGSGADTVDLDAYGNFHIETGDGSDFVQINSLATGNNGNATDGQWVFGPATSGDDTFGDRVLYKAELTVSFAGFESTVDVDTDIAGNFIADQMTINEAIMAAIDQSHELTDLLNYALGTDSQQLTIDSVIGGANTLAIALYQPHIADDTVDPAAGEVSLASGDETALAQGLINTGVVADSTDVDTTAEIITEMNDAANNLQGSVNQNGVGNGVTYTDITNDVAETVPDAASVDIFDIAPDVDLYQAYDLGGSSDSTTGVNLSTIDLGPGSNDIIVMHSSDTSANTLRITGAFGQASVVNFHDVSTDLVENAADVGMHALDFSTFLDDTEDVSNNAPNSQSEAAIVTTVNNVTGATAFGDSVVGDNLAEANSVNIIRFDGSAVADDDFEDLTASILIDALNDAADDGTTDFGNLDGDLLTPNLDPDLVGSQENHIVMVENDQNEGEYMVFHLTSNWDTVNDETTSTSAIADDDLFDAATYLGTLDFGASVNLNVTNTVIWESYVDNLIQALDDDAATFTYDANGDGAIGANEGETITPLEVDPTTQLTIAEYDALVAAGQTPAEDGYSLTDSAANLFAAAGDKLNNAVNITVTGTATVAQMSTILAATNSGTETYSLSDAADNLTAGATLNNATNIDVGADTATVAEAEVLADATNNGTTTFAISDGLTEVLAGATLAVAANKNGMEDASSITVDDLNSGVDQVVEFNNTAANAAATTIDFTSNAVTLREDEFDEVDTDFDAINADATVTINLDNANANNDVDLTGVDDNATSFVVNAEDGQNNTIVGSDNDDVVNGGTGGDTITGGAGADVITLGGAGANDSVVFNATTDGGTSLATADTITTFVAAGNEDKITIDGALKAAVDLAGAGTFEVDTSTGAAGGVATAATTELLFSTTANTALSNADMGDMAAVATALNGMFDFTTAPNGTVLALIAGDAATDHALYAYTEAGGSTGANAVDAGELVLLGVITSDQALTTTEIEIA